MNKKTKVPYLMLMLLMACSSTSRKDYDPAQPQAEQDNRQMLELVGDTDKPTKTQKVRLGFFEERIEKEDGNGKKVTVYHYTISLQLRCTKGNMIEAPLRGQLVKWNWDGVEKSAEVSDLNGLVLIEREYPQPMPQRRLTYEVHGVRGESNLTRGPYTIVLEGDQCTRKM